MKKRVINAGRTIPFANSLPRMRCGKGPCGTYSQLNWVSDHIHQDHENG